jgi:glycyl-tRNA synthetase beta chain
LEEQYAPRTPSDPLPSGFLGTYLSIADKIDTICGCFLADLIPTGSQDPYGLRRQAVGLIRILEERPLITLDRLIETSLEIYERSGVTVLKDTGQRAADFFKTRLETLMKEKGIAYDIIGAVIPLSWMAPAVCINRGRTLQAFRGDRSFELLITGVKRVGNILSSDVKTFGRDWEGIENAFCGPPDGGGEKAFSPELFDDEAEKALYDAILSKIPVMKALDEKLDFEGTVKVLSSFGSPIDRYFDKVLVNCEDKRLRNNRHRFLTAVFTLFSKYADFSFIVEEGSSA